MSKTMKRFVMFVAGLMVIFMLAACTITPNPNPTEPSNPTEPVTEPPTDPTTEPPTVPDVKVEVSFAAEGATVNSITVTEGQAYGALPTVEREGYTFGGWYLNDTCSGDAVTAATIVTAKEAHTLYAKWIFIEPEGMWYGFSSADCTSNLLYGGAFTSWLESYDGATGVIKLSAYNDFPFYGHDNGITWQPAFAAAAYEGATGLKFRVKCEGAF